MFVVFFICIHSLINAAEEEATETQASKSSNIHFNKNEEEIDDSCK